MRRIPALFVLAFVLTLTGADTLRKPVSEDAAFTHMSGTHHWEKRDGEWVVVNDPNR